MPQFQFLTFLIITIIIFHYCHPYFSCSNLNKSFYILALVFFKVEILYIMSYCKSNKMLNYKSIKIIKRAISKIVKKTTGKIQPSLNCLNVNISLY